jgi:hypothetical protein
MAITVLTEQRWTRKHDPKDEPTRERAEIICFDTWEDIVEICRSRPLDKRMMAAGSHWALSEAALADDYFIETNRPGLDNVPRYSGLAKDFGAFISGSEFQRLVDKPPPRPEKCSFDPCLNLKEGYFYVHLKSGTRVYEAYTLLDDGPPDSKLTSEGSLAHRLNERLGSEDAYSGPWAFQTLGSAGGQTVVGALTTGTHGGDYRQRPISDGVAAIHLVADGGDHFWIEPDDSRAEHPITDDARLRAYYGTLQGVTFHIRRDSDLFDAVMVGAGRFGVVASVVLRVVPQYCLLEHRVLEDWSEVKRLLKSGNLHYVFGKPYFPPAGRTEAVKAFRDRFHLDPALEETRFLQIAINVCPHLSNEHRCGITQRWFVPHSTAGAKNADGSLCGRNERGTLETAGKTHPYTPPEDDEDSGSSGGTFLEQVCANGNFLAGILKETADEIQSIIERGVVPAAGVGTGALALGAGSGLLNMGASLCAVLGAAMLALRAIAAALDALGDVSLAEAADALITGLLNNPLIPRVLTLMILRAIMLQLFESQQTRRNYVALSYAAMDWHDYKDRSCYGNAESIEVFFDATRPDVYCSYLDQVLAYEGTQQENDGRVTIGYISLRYVKQSHALLAPSRFEATVVMEIAGIRDASGSVPFIRNAEKVARHPMFGVPFHWGQSNPLERAEVERIFDGPPRYGDLAKWRSKLRDVETTAGRRGGFSSTFTRRTGLES